MTLEEMDTKLTEEAAERAERIKKFQATRSAIRDIHIGVEDPNSPLARSFYCQHNHHADCRWDECKCVCHDSSDWAMGRSC